MFGPGTGFLPTFRTIAGKQYPSVDVSRAIDLVPAGKSESVAGDAINHDGKPVPIPLCSERVWNELSKLDRVVTNLRRVAATDKGREELPKWGRLVNDLLNVKCSYYFFFFAMVGKEQRSQASGYETWNDYLGRPEIRKLLRLLMKRHSIDVEFLGDKIWGEVNSQAFRTSCAVFSFWRLASGLYPIRR